jgi:hypothetical protein
MLLNITILGNSITILGLCITKLGLYITKLGKNITILGNTFNKFSFICLDFHFIYNLFRTNRFIS